MGAMMLTVMMAVVFAGMVGPAVAQELVDQDTGCAASCLEGTKFHYKEGEIYLFNYETLATFLGGDSHMGLIAQAYIKVAGKCEMILKLSEVKVLGNEIDGYKIENALMNNQLRFGFVDGKVVSVCPTAREFRWIVNIKRAILSTFQNSMENFDSDQSEWVDEADVVGQCASNYESIKIATGYYNVSRSRNSSCVPPAQPPTDNILSSVLQMLPLLSREQKCFQTIKDGKLLVASCQENIRLPWDTNQNLPLAFLSTRLDFMPFVVKDMVLSDYHGKRLTLIMEWEEDASNKKAPHYVWMEMALQIIKSLNENAPSPSQFYQLTNVLKSFDYGQLTELIMKVSPDHWNMAMTTIAELGTESSMKVLDEFIEHNTLQTDLLKKIVVDVIRYFKVNPTMIKIMEKVLRKWPSFDQIESKMNSYCRNNPDCYADKTIKSILGFLSYHAGVPNCDISMEESHCTNMYCVNELNNENALKLYRWSSVGYWNQSLTPKLTQCIESKYTENKYAALQVLRNAPWPCEKYNFVNLMTQGESPSDDYYINIMKYLTLIRCKNDHYSKFLKEKLIENEVNQETSFIWTHLVNMNDSFSRDIVNDETLKMKYDTSVLKFSRNIRKDFNVMNRNVTVNINLIFSDGKLKPQYTSMEIYTEGMDTNILDVEIREKTRVTNQIRIDDIISVKIKGILIFEEKIDLEDSFNINPVSFFILVLTQGTYFWSMFSYSYLELLSDNYYSFIHYISNDIVIQYPTLAGLPFQLKMNMSSASNNEYFPPFASKQLDIQMLIDAKYINIGTKVQGNFDAFPGLNFTSKDKYVGEIIVQLPEKKNRLFNFEIGLYNIKNNRLSLKYQSFNDRIQSYCLPLLKHVIGSSLCWEYLINSDPSFISKYQYQLVHIKTEDFEGHNVTINSRDGLEFHYKHLGNEDDEYYHLRLRTKNPFINVLIDSPHFSLNGAGKYSSADEAINIGGILTYNDIDSPFTLTSYSSSEGTIDGKKFKMFFNSSILEFHPVFMYDKIEDNLTASFIIPYKFYNMKSENISFDLKSMQYDLFSEQKHFQMEASAALTELPSAVIFAGLYVDHSKNYLIGESFDVKLNEEISFNDHSMTSKFSGKWGDDRSEATSVFRYQNPTTNVVWTDSLTMGDGINKILFDMVVDDAIVYSVEGNYGMSMEKGTIYSNAIVLIPSAGATKIELDQTLQLAMQQLNIRGSKTSYGHLSEMNLLAGLVIDETTGKPSGFGEFLHHQLVFNSTSDLIDPFGLLAETRLSNNMRDLTLSVNVQTPFQRWDKDSFKLNFNKTGHHVEVSISEKRKEEEEMTYVFEGISDIDMLN